MSNAKMNMQVIGIRKKNQLKSIVTNEKDLVLNEESRERVVCMHVLFITGLLF